MCRRSTGRAARSRRRTASVPAGSTDAPPSATRSRGLHRCRFAGVGRVRRRRGGEADHLAHQDHPLRNSGGTAARYRASYQAITGMPGVSYSLSDIDVTVPPHGSATVDVTLQIDRRRDAQDRRSDDREAQARPAAPVHRGRLRPGRLHPDDRCHRAAAGSGVRGPQADVRHHRRRSSVAGDGAARRRLPQARRPPPQPGLRRPGVPRPVQCAGAAVHQPPARRLQSGRSPPTAPSTGRRGAATFATSVRPRPPRCEGGRRSPRTRCSSSASPRGRTGQHRRQHDPVRRHRHERRRRSRLRDVRLPTLDTDLLLAETVDLDTR